MTVTSPIHPLPTHVDFAAGVFVVRFVWFWCISLTVLGLAAGATISGSISGLMACSSSAHILSIFATCTRDLLRATRDA